MLWDMIGIKECLEWEEMRHKFTIIKEFDLILSSYILILKRQALKYYFYTFFTIEFISYNIYLSRFYFTIFSKT